MAGRPLGERHWEQRADMQPDEVKKKHTKKPRRVHGVHLYKEEQEIMQS